jgi:hypothetical protein
MRSGSPGSNVVKGIRGVASLLAVAMVAPGCATTETASATTATARARAPSPLRIYLAEDVDLSIRRKNDSGVDKWGIIERVRTELVNAGYVLVLDLHSAYDVYARIQLSDWDTYSDGQGGGRAALALSVKGVLVDVIQTHVFGSDYKDELADRLVRNLNVSQRVFAVVHSTDTVSPPQGAARTTAEAAPTAKASLGADAYLRAMPQQNAFALVVGIETYRDAPAPLGARADAQRFAEIAAATLGVPSQNMFLAIDQRAGRADIEKHLAWLASNVPAGGRIFFFFSGHGAPDPSTGTSYLLPYDGDPSALDTTALRLSDVLGQLSRTQAHDVVAFVDSCFSGAGGRSVLPKGVRPMVVSRAPEPAAHVALLTAASGAEISGPGPKGGGLLTTYIAEGLGQGQADFDGDGSVSLQELFDYVKPRVVRAARRDNRAQTPSLLSGDGMGPASTVMLASGIAPRESR